jgi:diadenosine tetraphosphate (Ap4A) HIT family hydrolase
MPSVFTMIIDGDLPGRFVYRDDIAAAFLTIEPITPGHTLVVPVVEVDHWIDLEPDIAKHLMTVAQRVGQALDRVFEPTRVAMIIAGLEVPHTHLHVVAIESESDLSFARADRNPDPAELDRIAERLAAEING